MDGSGEQQHHDQHLSPPSSPRRTVGTGSASGPPHTNMSPLQKGGLVPHLERGTPPPSPSGAGAGGGRATDFTRDRSDSLTLEGVGRSEPPSPTTQASNTFATGPEQQQQRMTLPSSPMRRSNSGGARASVADAGITETFSISNASTALPLGGVNQQRRKSASVGHGIFGGRWGERPDFFFTIPEDGETAAGTAVSSSLGGLSSQAPIPSPTNQPNLQAPPHQRHKRGSTGNTATAEVEPELMGPILRRKKVVSMPYGDSVARQFFLAEEVASRTTGASLQPSHFHSSPQLAVTRRGERQETPQSNAVHAEGARQRKAGRNKTKSWGMEGLLRRRQVSLDLLAPQRADFFADDDDLILFDENVVDEEEEGGETFEEEVAPEPSNLKPPTESPIASMMEPEQRVIPAEKMKLFRPLVFSKPKKVAAAAGGGHGPPHGLAETEPLIHQEPSELAIDEETKQAVRDHEAHTAEMKQQLEVLNQKIAQQGGGDPQFSASLLQFSRDLMETQKLLEKDQVTLNTKLLTSSRSLPMSSSQQQHQTQDLESGGSRAGGVETDDFVENNTLIPEEELALDDDGCPTPTSMAPTVYSDPHILRAKKKDYIMTAFLVVIMAGIVGICLGWHTHPYELNIFGAVGLACATPCYGDLVHQDFFHGKYSWGSGEVISLGAYLDHSHYASSESGTAADGDAFGAGHRRDRRAAEGGGGSDEYGSSYMIVDIVSTPGNLTKKTIRFGPADSEERQFFQERVFTSEFENPSDDHVINVYSTKGEEDVLTFTLSATVLEPISMQSVLIAALLMIFVYMFILFEVIHRTLVAIFGSMVALFIFFIMHDGHTESIKAVMLHMEWSTLGLLFGMMLIVGELSHTGIFEFTAVRLLVASKGSFKRLVVLLCTLTAVASAFLDNVTTMLLVAPVTIDMCKILDVDPRPYLIGEVILSNVGGTATLIGDPPNIIIGSAYAEIGFVDFIIYIAPCIFLFCIPVSLFLVVQIYKPYFTASKMSVLDVPKLKRTYPIYDQPRLLIAGTVAFFVILLFFLHPLHHKDTAWIALVGAFITMAFTNPHDVQSALRNHIEWDTLLFFAGLFVLVEVCAAMGLLRYIGTLLATYIESQPEESQLAIAITLILWVSAITSAFLDNIPYTATMIPVVRILAESLPQTLPLKTLAWALSFGACLGGNGTLLGASANIVTAGISTNKGFDISFLNFFYPGMIVMAATVAIANLYMLVVFVWI